MADLKTTYLGLELTNPIAASAGPLGRTLESIRELEDAGIGAVVLHSLFEEQVTIEQKYLNENLVRGEEHYAEALSYFPDFKEFVFAPDEYLDHLRKAKDAVEVPVIGSLNGTSRGGWTEYSWQMEQAGADAIELNIYYLPTDVGMTSQQIEDDYIELFRAVKERLTIPVSVKLVPFISAIPNVARRLYDEGAKGLVLFNRFYQPDIDPENLEVRPTLALSTPDELLLRLRWTAILYGRVGCDLAITGGVHRAEDVIKGIMSGAAVAMTTSALLQKGAGHARTLRDGLSSWLDEHEYGSVSDIRGIMSHEKVAEPAAFERANYMKIVGTGD
ncbi:MAG TPA: dihydroorotate dehydrogenase-like protein [Candidatus Eisenbacteria bacterium]|uniref:Dihydroorotate dehydrogenase-like protein n=1 Tax=Eiseniibacteriota bacterium TaxID=2212470 RepID=A0A7V2ATK3_UNCEI|nr:dihydroorotate dehydrogenase-like protein [Candidatus Eisenbacteria bacterium]